ncbi:6-bladed beta-propeller [Balneola vulgaris]|uniref:6-bladed beta-propeller n=1 Tax=Balneola vulgaris TaxID=287535 RepID=UPI0023E1D1F0|nr:6-bladed beta-propeller [Balneola vulgaris]
MPTIVVANSEGDIYVADERQGSVLVFDKEGSYIKSIGNKGRGPGEFSKISEMAILPNDEVLVFDFFQRRFTTFSNKGEVLETKVLPKDVYMYPDYLMYMGENKILSYNRLMEGVRKQIPPEKDFLMHEVSLNDFKVVQSFVPIIHTIDVNKDFERYFEGKFYKGLITYRDNILTLAPFFYRGKILQYKKTNGAWKLKKVFEGYRETERVYVEYENPREVIGKGMASNPKQYGPLAGIMKNESLGIFQKQNGDYLHLGLLEIGDGQKLYVNLFDEQGELKAHGPVTNLHPGIQKNDFYRRMRFYWMDEQDQLYVIDGAEDGFYVYRGTIELKE